MKILFSCMGTSDPVRGYRDGPMLHIIRHYRPDRICVFLSDEAAALDRCGKRLETVAAHIKRRWNGYAPEMEVICTGIEDPSDMDAVAKPMTDAVMRLAEEYPEGKILLNLSSGTPQMKIILSFLAADMRLNTLGIQVKNPDRAAGSTERTNIKDYSVADELECNEDESAAAPNRCTEPELMHVQRQRAREQTIALLDARNYSAVYAMKNSMPDSLKALVGHLEARDRLQEDEAQKRARALRLPFSLYPAKGARSPEYAEVSEAYLVLLNRCHRRQYEELILRLNPLIVRLELALMKKALASRRVRLENVIERPYSNRPRFYSDMLKKELPMVYAKVCGSFGTSALKDDSDVSLILCMNILKGIREVFGDCGVLTDGAMELIGACHTLNDSFRNKLAHQLTAVTEEQICAACGMEPAQLLNRVGELIAALYPECDTKLFRIYKQCGDYIKERLY